MAQNQETISYYCKLCGSLKKWDPTTAGDLSGDGQPQLKKRGMAYVHDYRLHGFTRVDLPPQNFYPSLGRLSSDVVKSPGLDQPKQPSSENFPHSPQAPRMNLNVSTLSPSPVKAGSTELPPLPPLRRSVTDPLPVETPPRTGNSGEMNTGSPAISHKSPDPERFKRMIDRMKDMKQWWDDVVLEAEDAGSHHNNTNASIAGTEEEVSIERLGEYLMIYLKCPCSKVYQLLISGSSCYYKLM